MQTLKVERIMRIKLIAVLALFVTMSAACMAQSPAQTPAQPQTTSSKIDALRVDLQAAKTGLLEDSGTLVEMEGSLLGTVAGDNASSIVTAIQLAMTETDAANWFIAPYTQIGCDQDRGLMKAVLQNRLKLYSHLLDLNMTSISGQLAYTTAPAVSQVALRAQDRMRNAQRDMQSVLDLIQ